MMREAGKAPGHGGRGSGGRRLEQEAQGSGVRVASSETSQGPCSSPPLGCTPQSHRAAGLPEPQLTQRHHGPQALWWADPSLLFPHSWPRCAVRFSRAHSSVSLESQLWPGLGPGRNECVSTVTYQQTFGGRDKMPQLGECPHRGLCGRLGPQGGRWGPLGRAHLVSLESPELGVKSVFLLPN